MLVPLFTFSYVRISHSSQLFISEAATAEPPTFSSFSPPLTSYSALSSTGTSISSFEVVYSQLKAQQFFPSPLILGVRMVRTELLTTSIFRIFSYFINLKILYYLNHVII